MRPWVISSGEKIKVQKEKAVSGQIALSPAQGVRTEVDTQVRGGTRHFIRTGSVASKHHALQVRWEELLPHRQ